MDPSLVPVVTKLKSDVSALAAMPPGDPANAKKDDIIHAIEAILAAVQPFIPVAAQKWVTLAVGTVIGFLGAWYGKPPTPAPPPPVPVVAPAETLESLHKKVEEMQKLLPKKEGTK